MVVLVRENIVGGYDSLKGVLINQTMWRFLTGFAAIINCGFINFRISAVYRILRGRCLFLTNHRNYDHDYLTEKGRYFLEKKETISLTTSV